MWFNYFFWRRAVLPDNWIKFSKFCFTLEEWEALA